jgi:hypothetical protein
MKGNMMKYSNLKKTENILITLIMFLLAYPTFARADVMTEMKQFESAFMNKPQLQRATLQNISYDSYGMCVPFVMSVMVSEIKGTKFPESGITSAAFLMAATAYYRKAKLSAGVPEAVFDNASKPYMQEFKVDMDGAFRRYVNPCMSLANKIATDSSK